MSTHDEILRLSRLLDQGLSVLRTNATALANAEHDYRLGRAKAWASVDRQNIDGTKRFSAEIESEVDALTADLREARDIAEGMRQAALESIRSRRQQLSALQSLMASDRAEAEFARTSP